jgi:hypothetical protein
MCDREWLLMALDSAENQLAQYILNHLDWSEDEYTHALFLSEEFHTKTALIILEAFLHHKSKYSQVRHALIQGMN